MLALAVDTSGKHGSVALVRGNADFFEVLQLVEVEGGTYSAQLMPRISDLLRQNGIVKGELDGFSVVSGPGSFTGLRVGLATVKGLCEVLGKPLAAVSMLEALALEYGQPGGQITAVLDAGRGEVYAGEYRIAGRRAEMMRESIAKLDGFAGSMPQMGGEIVTPDEGVAGALSGRARLVTRLSADAIGRIGIHKLLAGDVVDPASLDASYIRRSDAEIFSAT